MFRIGVYEFRPAVKVLIDEKGKKLRLTDKEASILKYLYRAGSKPVSREELAGRGVGLQRRCHNPTRSRPTSIACARKIEPEPANSRLLITEAGGYRLSP